MSIDLIFWDTLLFLKLPFKSGSLPMDFLFFNLSRKKIGIIIKLSKFIFLDSIALVLPSLGFGIKQSIKGDNP